MQRGDSICTAKLNLKPHTSFPFGCSDHGVYSSAHMNIEHTAHVQLIRDNRSQRTENIQSIVSLLASSLCCDHECLP
jgi:hypothetical protein